MGPTSHGRKTPTSQFAPAESRLWRHQGGTCSGFSFHTRHHYIQTSSRMPQILIGHDLSYIPRKVSFRSTKYCFDSVISASISLVNLEYNLLRYVPHYYITMYNPRNLAPLSAAEQLGKTKIFIKNPHTLFDLEDQRTAALFPVAVMLQSKFRAYTCRRRYLHFLAIFRRVGALVRGFLARIRYRRMVKG